MEPEQTLHTEAMLLPGFVNRTLSSEEEQQVASHLQTCVTCQQELQEVTNMQAAIKHTIAQRPGPSPAAFSTLMRRIEQEKQAQGQRITQPTTSSWWERVESAFRSLFEIQWVPALASVLIVGQAFLLLSLIGTPEGQQGQGSGTIYERGIPQGTPATPSLKIEVQFVETAQERPIRGLVRDLGGRIIDGPTEDGRYTLGFPISPGLSSDSILTMLGKHPELVQKAQLLGP